MPTYQYTCTDCGEPVEAVQKFTDDPLTVCAACGGRLRKVFSPVGIVFKGSGFYRTDSRNGSSSSRSETANGKQPSESAAKSSESGGSADKSGTSKTSSETSGASSKPSSAAKEKVA